MLSKFDPSFRLSLLPVGVRTDSVLFVTQPTLLFFGYLGDVLHQLLVDLKEPFKVLAVYRLTFVVFGAPSQACLKGRGVTAHTVSVPVLLQELPLLSGQLQFPLQARVIENFLNILIRGHAAQGSPEIRPSLCGVSVIALLPGELLSEQIIQSFIFLSFIGALHPLQAAKIFLLLGNLFGIQLLSDRASSLQLGKPRLAGLYFLVNLTLIPAQACQDALHPRLYGQPYVLHAVADTADSCRDFGGVVALCKGGGQLLRHAVDGGCPSLGLILGTFVDQLDKPFHEVAQLLLNLFGAEIADPVDNVVEHLIAFGVGLRHGQVDFGGVNTFGASGTNVVSHSLDSLLGAFDQPLHAAPQLLCRTTKVEKVFIGNLFPQLIP